MRYSSGSRPEGDRPLARRTSYALYLIAAGLIFAGLLVACQVLVADEEVWNAVALVGVAITLAAVGASIHIFNQQSIDSVRRSQEREMKQAVTLLDLELDGAEEKARSDADAAPDVATLAEEAELVDTTSASATYEANGKTWRIYPKQEVPLFVIADLVIHWRSEEHPGRRDGNWLVQNLVGAARPVGKGSHPWIVIFHDRRGERAVYRLFRGGRGNAGANAGHVRRLE